MKFRAHVENALPTVNGNLSLSEIKSEHIDGVIQGVGRMRPTA
jgi:hypothetical protein